MKVLPIIAALTDCRRDVGLRGGSSPSGRPVSMRAKCRGTGWAYTAQSARELHLVDDAPASRRGAGWMNRGTSGQVLEQRRCLFDRRIHRFRRRHRGHRPARPEISLTRFEPLEWPSRPVDVGIGLQAILHVNIG